VSERSTTTTKKKKLTGHRREKKKNNQGKNSELIAQKTFPKIGLASG
jgi:hypothetical protein